MNLFVGIGSRYFCDCDNIIYGGRVLIIESLAFSLLMYLLVIEENYRLVNVPELLFLGGLRPLDFSFERNAYCFCVPRDRWDKEFFKLQSG